MPSKKRSGKDHGFGDWLENLFENRPELIVFILVLLLAFSIGAPFMAWDLSDYWQTMLGSVRESVLNGIGVVSVFLGLYAIHQATVFKRESDREKTADDLRRKLERRALENSLAEIKDNLRVVLYSTRRLEELVTARVGRGENKEWGTADDGDSLSGKDTTK